MSMRLLLCVSIDGYIEAKNEEHVWPIMMH